MTDFTPIPGVTYEVKFYPDRTDSIVFTLTYCPTSADDERPWLDPFDEYGCGYRKLPDGSRILREVYNPHPPTRTEWALSWYGADDADQSKEPFGENEAKARERHAAFLKNPARPYTRRLMRRQVTETEWQEVDQ